MATKKTPKTSEDPLDLPGNEAELEQAIDGLRGVLKQDATGEAPSFGGDLSDFGGDFGDSDIGGASASETTSLSTFGDFGDDNASSSSFDMGDLDTPSFSSAASPTAGSALTANLDLIMDIPIDVQIVLGTSKMQVSGLMNLTEGAIIALDKRIGEPVEMTVNGRRIARGEITVLENDDTRFGVKLIEVLKTTKA